VDRNAANAAIEMERSGIEMLLIAGGESPRLRKPKVFEVHGSKYECLKRISDVN